MPKLSMRWCDLLDRMQSTPDLPRFPSAGWTSWCFVFCCIELRGFETVATRGKLMKLGKNILGSDLGFDLQVSVFAAAAVSGEDQLKPSSLKRCFYFINAPVMLTYTASCRAPLILWGFRFKCLCVETVWGWLVSSGIYGNICFWCHDLITYFALWGGQASQNCILLKETPSKFCKMDGTPPAITLSLF